MSNNDLDLIAKLVAATEGLCFMSETDAPLEVSTLPNDTDLSAESLRKMTGKGPDDPVEQRTPEAFFRASMKEHEGQNETGRAIVARFRNLYSLIESELRDVRVFRVGEINVAALVIGQAPSGALMVLRTNLVET